MTQEEKAKAYDNVREKIVVRFGSNVANEIFSEYEESEDERIRKDLILYLKSVLSNKKYGDKFIESWIAWLEKQAEQKPVVIIPKFRVGDKIKTSNEESLTITKIDEKGYWSEDLFICDFDEECLWDLVEQKPAWSEEVQEEPVSEPNKELAETYLAVFNKKFPILPSLKGKQLADYKDFLNKCQQIFSLKEWGTHPIQSKLFEKLTLLWAAWGAEHLQGVGRQDEKEQDIPISEELEEAARKAATWHSRVRGDMFFPNDYHKFVAGAKWQKEQMIAKAIDAHCFGFQGAALFSFRLPADKYLVGSEVKVIVIKEE